jgi:hypothetical protein
MKKSAVGSSGVGGRLASAARTHFTKSAEMVNKTVHFGTVAIIAVLRTTVIRKMFL